LSKELFSSNVPLLAMYIKMEPFWFFLLASNIFYSDSSWAR
jgi:hypothetical protein